MNLKNKILLLFVKTYQKRKGFPYMEMTRDNDLRGRNILLWKYHVTLAVTYSYQIIVQLSFSKINSLLSATSFLSRSPMAYNITETLDKLACTDNVDFGKRQDRLGRLSWSKNDSNYWEINLKVFKREDKNAEFRQRQKLSMGEADFNQFVRRRNELVVAADNFLREPNLSPVLQSTLSKHMEEQLKLVHKVIDVVDRPYRKICVTLLQYKARQTRDLLCSSSSMRAEEGGRKISTICVCQL